MIPGTKTDRILSFWSKAPRTNVFEQEAKLKKDQPAMNLYTASRPQAWIKKNENFQRFLKGERDSFVDKIFKLKKQAGKRTPGPGAYTVKNKNYVGYAKLTSPQIQMYSHQVWQNTSRPGYVHNINYNQVCNRVITPKYGQP
jgi:hypothetical protein